MVRRGLPKTYAKMGFKKGWKAYKASGESKSKPKTKVKRKVARRRTYRKKRRRRTKTIPLAPIGGLVASVAMPSGFGHSSPLSLAQSGQYGEAVKSWFTSMTGYSAWTGKFNPMEAKGLHALLIGVMVHKVAGWLGVNRTFSNLPSPLNKLRI